MTKLLDEAITALGNLKTRPATEQDMIAHDVLEMVADEMRWKKLFSDPRSESVLSDMVKEARAEIARGDVCHFDPATKQK